MSKDKIDLNNPPTEFADTLGTPPTLPPQGDEQTSAIAVQMVGMIVVGWKEETAKAYWKKALNVLARLDAAGFLRTPDEIIANAQREATEMLERQRQAMTTPTSNAVN